MFDLGEFNFSALSIKKEDFDLFYGFNRTIKLDNESFYFESCQFPSTGKLISVHNINNENIPFIQELGEKEQQFQLVIAVSGKGSNGVDLKNDYIEQKMFLENIIKNQKIVTFTAYDFSTVKVKIINSSPTVKSYNYITYDLTLLVIPDTYEEDAKFFLNTVTAKKKSLFNKFNDLLSKTAWITEAVGFIGKYITQNIAKFNNIVNKIGTQANGINQILNKVSGAVDAIKNTINNIAKIITMPAQWFNNLVNIWENVLSIGTTVENAMSMIANAYDFSSGKKVKSSKISVGSGEALTSGNFIEDNQKNLDNLMVTTNNIAMTYAFSGFILDAEFKDDIQLKQCRELFNTIIEDSISNNDMVDIDTKNALLDLKIELNNYLTEELNNVRNIIDFTITSEDSLYNLVYNYYGNTDNYDDILNLNKDTIMDIICLKKGDIIKIYA